MTGEDLVEFLTTEVVPEPISAAAPGPKVQQDAEVSTKDLVNDALKELYRWPKRPRSAPMPCWGVYFWRSASRSPSSEWAFGSRGTTAPMQLLQAPLHLASRLHRDPFHARPVHRAPLRFGFTVAGARRHHPQLPGPGIRCFAPPRPEVISVFRTGARRCPLVLVILALSGCSSFLGCTDTTAKRGESGVRVQVVDTDGRPLGVAAQVVDRRLEPHPQVPSRSFRTTRRGPSPSWRSTW